MSDLSDTADANESGPPSYSSDMLFGAYNEVTIVHGDAHYRLRKTRQGKLILNK